MDKYIERFRAELLKIENLCDASVALYIQAIYKLSTFLKDRFKTTVIKAKKSHLIQWFLFQKDEIKLSPNTLNVNKAGAMKFFIYLKNWGVIEKNPVMSIPRAKVRPEKHNKVLPKSIMIQLLDYFDLSTWAGLRDRLMVALLWTLGLRLSELIAIKLKDLRLDYDPKHFIGMLLVHGKGQHERSLFITGRLYKVIVHYLAHSESPKSKNDPLICHLNRTPLNSDKVRNIIKYAKNKAGISQKITSHLIRHTFATEMFHLGVPVDALGDLLGHENTTDTSTYIHISEKVKADTLDKLTTGRII